MVLGLRRLPRFMLALSLLGLLLGTLPAPAVSAATTYTVNVLTDTGAGSGTTGDLRYAITQVNAGGGGDTINITATGTITLTGGTLMLNKDVMITGPGANLLAIDGGCTTCDPGGTFTDGVRVFAIGKPHRDDQQRDHPARQRQVEAIGGAIENSGGTLTLRDATIARNMASSAAASTKLLDADRRPDHLRGEHGRPGRRHQQQQRRHPDGDQQHLRQQPGAVRRRDLSTTTSTRRASPPRRSAATARAAQAGASPAAGR